MAATEAIAPTIVSVDGPCIFGRVTLTATLSDGTTEQLFSFFIDEHAVTDQDDARLVGLTVAEARAAFHKADVAYLQAP